MSQQQQQGSAAVGLFSSANNPTGTGTGSPSPSTYVVDSSSSNEGTQSLHPSNNNIKSYIGNLYGDVDTHDVVLLVGASKYPVHKVIVSRSPVFKAMMYGTGWQESAAKEIYLTEESQYVTIFEDFVKYLYGHPLQLSWQNVEALVYFGDKYAVDSLLNDCLDFFCSEVERSGDLLSALNGWKIVRRILNQRQSCMSVLRSLLFSNIELVMKNDSIISAMDEDDMIAFFSSDDVVCRTEFTLFKLFETWLLSNPDESARMLLLLRFSSLFRLSFMHVQEMRYVETSPRRMFTDEASENFKVAMSTMKSLLCDAYKYHVFQNYERVGIMNTVTPRLYLDGKACMKYRLLNTDGLSSWSKMDSFFKMKPSMSQADVNSREWSFCVTLMRKINVQSSVVNVQRLSVLSLEVSQNFCGSSPFKSGVVYIHERRAGSVIRRPLTKIDFNGSKTKSDIKLENVNFEDVVVKNSLYQYDDDLGNLIYLALDVFLLE